MAPLTSPDVIVVGAGCAGLSAASRLAAGGLRVLVLEKRARLGGRATAFVDRESGERVDNGQHALLGCYTSTFEFLREIGASDRVRAQSSLAVTMIDPEGRASKLSCPHLPPPLHLLAGVFEWDALTWGDRWSLLSLARPLRVAQAQARRERAAVEAGEPFDARPGPIAASPGETVDQWLRRNGQGERIRELLWEPLALAALNQPPTVASAPPFARVLAEMFGPEPGAAGIVLPSVPLDEMYAAPARAFIEARGGDVRLGAEARIRLDAGRVSVEVGGATCHAPIVVCAVPWFALGSVVVGDTEALEPVLAAARETQASPIVTVNLWFDRVVFDDVFVGLPGRRFQWVFDKRLVFGGNASHLSLVASGAGGEVDETNGRLIEIALVELREALPGVRAAECLRGTVIREPRATFSLAPGQPGRPGVRTSVQGLFLASDWVDTGLPATIESAVRAGHMAAAAAVMGIQGMSREAGR